VSNPEKLLFDGILIAFLTVATVLHHRRSGESIGRLRQVDTSNAPGHDLIAIGLLVLFVLITDSRRTDWSAVASAPVLR
jgi:hypothetical protein